MNPRFLSSLEYRFDELRRQIGGLLHRYGISKEDREDLEQEVLLQAYTHLNDSIEKGDTDIRSLLDSRLIATITSRRRIDSIRRARDPARSALTNQFECPEDESALGLAETATESVHTRASENPADAYLRKERTSYLQSQLTPAEQVLLVRVAGGWTDSDVAVQQGITVAAAKWRIQDMKAKCRRILKAYDAGPR